MDLDTALTGKPAEGATATQILRADHGEVRRLFVEFGRAQSEPHTRHVAVQAVCMQLELHDELEKSVFYAVLRELERDFVEAALREHDEIAGIVDQLRELAECDEHCVAKVERLKALVEAHVYEEEHVLFPRVEEHDEAWLRDLGIALVKRKEELTRSTEEFEGPAT